MYMYIAAHLEVRRQTWMNTCRVCCWDRTVPDRRSVGSVWAMLVAVGVAFGGYEHLQQ